MRLPSHKGLAVAAGALALGLAFSWPAGEARAAQPAGPVGAAAGLADGMPVEMQRRRDGGFRGHHGGRRHFGHRRGGGGGGGAALLGLGAAAAIIGGAAAAAAAREPRECWIERRWVDGPYGPERVRVRVCD